MKGGVLHVVALKFLIYRLEEWPIGGALVHESFEHVIAALSGSGFGLGYVGLVQDLGQLRLGLDLA